MHTIINFIKNLSLKFYLFIILILILIPFVIFLNSIHFKLGGYLNFMWDYKPIKNFDEHKAELETLVNDIESFVNNTPDFYNEFNSNFYLKDNSSLIFSRKRKTPKDPDFKYQYDLEDTDKIKNYTAVFPEDFKYEHILIDSDYPGYVMFCGDETSYRVLVYTGGKGPPSKLIDSYWERWDFVYVHKISNDWYEITPAL